MMWLGIVLHLWIGIPVLWMTQELAREVKR